METLKYKSKSPSVYYLAEILNKLGYVVNVSDYFDLEIQKAVVDFQRKNQLVADGIVGVKTWTVLLQKESGILVPENKFLSEDDLIKFSEKYHIELAVVKAVNEVESTGKGFLISGKPKILFEGHVFWNELKKRSIEPEKLMKNNKDILYPKWTKKYYLGGENEYSRLEKAIAISSNPKVLDAALCSASWGAFQIMGYHYSVLGFHNVEEFVSAMKISEAEQLEIFGLYLQEYDLIQYLQNRNWEAFAKNYNGPAYARNKYVQKLDKAYHKYKNL